MSDHARYSVLAETDGGKCVWTVGLDLAALVTQIVMPYEEDEPFFIDGVPVSKEHLARFKLVRQSDGFAEVLGNIDHFLHLKGSGRSLSADEHRDKILQLFRTRAVDVTHTLVQAYVKDIKPSLERLDAGLERSTKVVEILAKLAPLLSLLGG